MEITSVAIPTRITRFVSMLKLHRPPAELWSRSEAFLRLLAVETPMQTHGQTASVTETTRLETVTESARVCPASVS